MKNRINLLFIVTVLVCILLSGCGNLKVNTKEDSTSKDELVIMIGNNYGSPFVDYSYFESDIKETFMAGGTITLIQMDATPSLLSKIKVNPNELVGKSKTNQNKTYDLYTQATVIAMNESLPDSSGVDIIASFLEVSKNISHDSVVKIICCSNMLGTDNTLVNMSHGVDSLSSHMHDILTTLEQQKNIPSFKNVKSIECYGAGTITTQEDNLTNSELNELHTFFEEFFNRSGCNHVSFETETLPQNVNLSIPSEFRNYPKIPVMHESIKVDNEFSDSWSENSVSRFSEETIQFVGDSASFVNEAHVAKVLQSLVDPINQEIAEGNKIALIGSTAALSPDSNGDSSLSILRAEAVKKVLSELGVENEDALLVYGVGYHPSFCKNNFNQDGSFNEEYGSYNRAVSIMLSTNPLVDIAKQL